MKSCQAPLLLSETQYKTVPESYRCNNGLWILRFYYNENTTEIIFRVKLKARMYTHYSISIQNYVLLSTHSSIQKWSTQ